VIKNWLYLNQFYNDKCEDVENSYRLSYIASSTHGMFLPLPTIMLHLFNFMSGLACVSNATPCYGSMKSVCYGSMESLCIFKCPHPFSISSQVWPLFQMPPCIVGGTLDWAIHNCEEIRPNISWESIETSLARKMECVFFPFVARKWQLAWNGLSNGSPWILLRCHV
jgi:hypothetical protein